MCPFVPNAFTACRAVFLNFGQRSSSPKENEETMRRKLNLFSMVISHDSLVVQSVKRISSGSLDIRFSPRINVDTSSCFFSLFATEAQERLGEGSEDCAGVLLLKPSLSWFHLERF